jgi:hypothetical protein
VAGRTFDLRARARAFHFQFLLTVRTIEYDIHSLLRFLDQRPYLKARFGGWPAKFADAASAMAWSGIEPSVGLLEAGATDVRDAGGWLGE